MTLYAHPLDVWRARLQTRNNNPPNNPSNNPKTVSFNQQKPAKIPTENFTKTSKDFPPKQSSQNIQKHPPTNVLRYLLEPQNRYLLYRGLSMSILRHIPGNALFFGVNEYLQQRYIVTIYPIYDHMGSSKGLLGLSRAIKGYQGLA